MGLSGRSAQGGRMMVCRFTRSVKGNPFSCLVLLSPLGCVMLKLVGFHDGSSQRRRAMEHRPLVDLQTLAHLSPAEPRRPMTRAERIERWMEALQREPRRRLRALPEIEHKPSEERRAIRVENSPISVAFEDMALRAEGLTGDTLGDAMDFFEISEREAHAALCSCLFGGTIETGLAAQRVSELLRPEQARSGHQWWGFFR